MKYSINCLYNYYDTLLSQWVDWNEGLLKGIFTEGAGNLTEALDADNSNERSRAKEFYRVGLLTHELTKGISALNSVKEGENLQSRLGFIVALLYRAYAKNPSSDVLLKSVAAINAIFSVIQPIEIDDLPISINTIAYRLLDSYPLPDSRNLGEWLRYLLSAFCCELKVATDSTEIKQILLGKKRNITLRIIGNKGDETRCTFNSSKDVENAIKNRVSLTNIHHQKMPLFLVGSPKDVEPRGFYGLAAKYYNGFLFECYKIEFIDVEKSPFKDLYVDDEGPTSKKGKVLETLKFICNQNEQIANKYQDIMKSIEEGSIEALMYMTDKPKDAFVKSWTPSKETGESRVLEDCTYAIRTKPFLLLAGISGTGKSRIVRELAFKSCPEYLQDNDGTTPGNYCMIEVKPNWHDSTELLGYYSNMNKCYQFKKFVKFLVKAKMFPKVPFFVCLDEMNLAPVEHYFAEMLSIMETRKHPKKEGTNEVDKEVVKTGTIVDAQHFREFAGLTDKNGNTYNNLRNDRDIYMKLHGIDTESDINEEVGKRTDLTTEGLTLPDNVIIIGTVNMDDTTHQFSRKVIDRAMTIEMNGGKLSNMFGGSKDLEYLPKDEQEKWQKSFRQLYVNADEVLEAHPDDAEDIVKKVPEKLDDINKVLKGTPFEVSYRVLNELTIMVGVLLDSKKEGETIDDIINQALDSILLMKILPRIEGDSDMFNLSRDFKQENHVEYNNRLEWLMDLAPEIITEEREGDDHRQTAREKIKEMMDRLENQEFTRFWP